MYKAKKNVLNLLGICIALYFFLLSWYHNFFFGICTLESVQDFLIKLDIKPLMQRLEISTFSLNNVIVKLTKIMNRADKNWAQY